MARGTAGRRLTWGLAGSAVVTVIAVGCLVLLGLRVVREPATATPEQVRTSLPGLVWSDEFEGQPRGVDTDLWRAAEGAGGWGNHELQNYTKVSANLAVDGQGSLAITAQREQTTDADDRDADYTSARIESRFTAPYGRTEARILVPAGAGLWSAFWTLGDNHGEVGWPTSGEIDVLETMNDTAEVNANVHAATQDDDGRLIGRWQKLQATTPAAPVGGSWHTYSVERQPGEIRFLLDDVEFHRVRADQLTEGQDWPFDQPQRLLLNLAVGGDWPGAPDSSTPFPAIMLVDYVRVFDTSVLDW